ncbi:exodeoxyribonuclease III [Candidatus Parvarchaeota archaeon]|nr:exodeoxyribonuclease III [Candidatus Parvarchaeota archaeon]
MINLLSWNINGIRSAMKKGLGSLIQTGIYDIILLQEVKAEVIPLDLDIEAYNKYIFTSKRKKGYSGTMTLSKKKPISIIYGIGDNRFDSEGRCITLEFQDFYVINAYFPNSRRNLERLGFKLDFDKKISGFSQELRKKKPVIIGGDFNVANEELDIARPKDNIGNAGFTEAERKWMKSFLRSGYFDCFRLFSKESGHYTWWTFRFEARKRNIGWRIDYFLVSEEIKDRVISSDILTEQYGSDHAPVSLKIR